MATDCRKLPREWKRLLCYHRLIWYILYMGNEVNSMLGWQVQLIAWLFTCWEWQENMNIIIENWNSIGILRTSRSDSNKPSLRAIVEHFIREDNKDEKMPTMPEPHEGSSQTTKGEMDAVSEHLENKEVAPETLVEGMDLPNNSDDPESNKGVQSNEAVKDQLMREIEGEADVYITRDYFEGKNRAMSQKLDDVVKEVREVEKALREEINKTLGREMYELRKEIDKLHKEIKELKEAKQQSEKNKKSEEERETRLKTWKRMRLALKRYDVSMEGIIAFQRFRFYCVAGYLPWPLPNEEIEDLRFLQTAR